VSDYILSLHLTSNFLRQTLLLAGIYLIFVVKKFLIFTFQTKLLLHSFWSSTWGYYASILVQHDLPSTHPDLLSPVQIRYPSGFAHITDLEKPAMLMNALVLLLSVLLMYSNIWHKVWLKPFSLSPCCFRTIRMKIYRHLLI